MNGKIIPAQDFGGRATPAKTGRRRRIRPFSKRLYTKREAFQAREKDLRQETGRWEHRRFSIHEGLLHLCLCKDIATRAGLDPARAFEPEATFHPSSRFRREESRSVSVGARKKRQALEQLEQASELR
ncbi:hypothetical protein A3D69_02635 [Candidatus Uhrbacteria bacterium RIFCSPHIGHO2_02_FULL_54_11]|nr:MAG: hypothetical protein A3D69_02635 [Candidatus Uhrbacteria bacterium RIFCSPHIGHO2_02_FULL_54_11]